MTEHIDIALSNPTPLNLFNAIYIFCTAPGTFLAPLFAPKQQQPPATYSPIQKSIKLALRLIARGQEGKAFKLLCSNGVAAVNDEALATLQAMHPSLQEELKLPQPTHTQVAVDESSVFQRLFQEAALSDTAKDVFGWTASLYFSVRGLPNGPLIVISRLICFIANNPTLIPDSCAKLLTAGLLTPLHKLGPAEQAERTELLLPPKLRPVNSGTLLAKATLSAVLSTTEAKLARARTAPFQLATGTKRGVELLVHICRAAHGSGHLVGRNDFANGFNSMSRQQMLLAHQSFFPEATGVFNLFYGDRAPVFVMDDAGDLATLWSEEGSRQGCAAGTEAFCMGLHQVLLPLQQRYPEYELRAITDDVIPIVPPPLLPTHAEWQATFVRYAGFLRDFKALAAEMGLTLNGEKGGLLLPADAPDPDPEVKALFEQGFDFRRDGFRIAGAPIGTNAFIQHFVNLRILEATAKVKAVEALGKDSARAAHRLLTTCASKLLNFLAATVPPNLCVAALAKFDDVLQDAFWRVLRFAPNECSTNRCRRAAIKASLPAPKGCGLMKVSDYACAAWWASVSLCLSDKLLFKLRAGLAAFAEPAFDCVRNVLGGATSKFWLPIKHLLPDQATGLLDGSVYSPGTQGRCKLGQVVMRWLNRLRLAHYKMLTAADAIDNYSLTVTDMIDSVARTDAGRIFSTPLSAGDSFFAAPFNNLQYIAFVRFFLGLPPLPTIGGATIQPGFDYQVQRCLSKHRGSSPFLDASACHASSNCPSTYSARNKKHSNVVMTLMAAAQAAGLQVHWEPDTYTLLLGQFSKAECRRIFPKWTTKEYDTKLTQIIDTVLNQTPNSAVTSQQQQAQLDAMVRELPLLKDADPVGLRIDLAVSDPASGETFWVDATVCHTTSPSYVRVEAQAAAARQIAVMAVQECKAPDIMKLDPSPILVQREKEKVEKYARLLAVAGKQCRDGRRSRTPAFVPFVFSDAGECAPEALEFQNWLVGRFKRHHKRLTRTDGQTVGELTAAFKRNLRVSLQLAVASGLGAMILAAGQPFRGLGEG
jgi:hypothetical protein